jgi:hypothetical protein
MKLNKQLAIAFLLMAAYFCAAGEGYNGTAGATFCLGYISASFWWKDRIT